MARRKKGRAPKGQGSVSELVKGEKYRVRVPIGRKPDGSTRQHSEVFHGTEADAYDYKAELITRRDRLRDPQHYTVDELLDRWFASKHGNIASTTYENYEYEAKHLRNAFAGEKARELAPLFVEEYFRQESAKQSLSALRTQRSILNQAFDYAIAMGIASHNPAKSVTIARPKPADSEYDWDEWDEDEVETSFEVWTAEQAAAFLRACEGERLYALWFMALTIGARIGELTALSWDDVQLDRKEPFLRIRRTLRKGGRSPRFGPPKTKKSKRIIGLDDEQVAVLRTQRAKENEKRLFYGQRWPKLNLVFTAQQGQAINRDSLRGHQFARMKKKAYTSEWVNGVEIKTPIPDIRIHDLRHTCATILLEEGVHPKVVQELLGHASIRTTLDTYSHVVPGLLAAAGGSVVSTIAKAQKAHSVRLVSRGAYVTPIR